MKNKIFLALITFMLITTLSGCIGVNRSFKHVRSNLFENLDMDYNREIEFSIGPAGLMLAGMIVRMTDVEEPIGEIISQISRVQVGVYKNEYTHSGKSDFEALKKLTDEMMENGWRYIVRTIDGNEMAAVFINEIEEDDEEISQLFVIAINGEELVLAEIHGDLNDIVEIALR
ncbi:MAG: DUF4252 domain-containing protein [Bacteroidetes bacterium]|nr:DUF4252 domain-containing protein [Bacteroidota bacterium]MBU1680722.1 DUF4252 domain-containing protein [Bacteroidota bacterium]MBU2505965.1 DUF4252 domain-containing protein [Bacteroidota bacterium]